MIDLSRPPTKAIGMVHELVAETAKQMAHAWYEEAAHDNAFYKAHPNCNKFVRRWWPSFIRYAREHLAELLNPVHNLPESYRQQIHEAILLNAAVNPASNLLN